MRKPWRVILGILLQVGILGCAQIPAQVAPSDSSPAVEAETTPQITLHVFNYARIPSSQLARGEAQADRIFRLAGLRVRWENYPSGAQEGRVAARCPGGCDASNLFLSILPANMWAEMHHHDPNAMGFAAVPEEGAEGSLAYISWSEIDDASQWVGVGSEEDEVLGCVVAHEVGHLLLRTTRHTPTGIMRARWGLNQMRRATEGALRFTSAQARLLRAEAAARARGIPDQTATVRPAK